MLLRSEPQNILRLFKSQRTGKYSTRELFRSENLCVLYEGSIQLCSFGSGSLNLIATFTDPRSELAQFGSYTDLDKRPDLINFRQFTCIEPISADLSRFLQFFEAKKDPGSILFKMPKDVCSMILRKLYHLLPRGYAVGLSIVDGERDNDSLGGPLKMKAVGHLLLLDDSFQEKSCLPVGSPVTQILLTKEREERFIFVNQEEPNETVSMFSCNRDMQLKKLEDVGSDIRSMYLQENGSLLMLGREGLFEHKF